MSTRLDRFIGWEIQPIERFLEEVPSFFEKRAVELARTEVDWLTPDGRLSESQVCVGARSLALAAAAYHLNALVDWVLLALTTRTLPPEVGLTADALSRSRAQLIKSIENEYKIDVRTLPGWDQVESLREDTNALKHRGGSSLPGPTSLGIPLFRQVTLNREILRQRIPRVREWLLALWHATEGSKSSDGVT